MCSQIALVHTSTLCNTLNTTFYLNHLWTTDLWRAQLRFCQKISSCSKCVLCPSNSRLKLHPTREEIALRIEKKMLAWHLTYLKTYELVKWPYWNLTILITPELNLVIGQLGNGPLVNNATCNPTITDNGSIGNVLTWIMFYGKLCLGLNHLGIRGLPAKGWH